jgi:hypothetical protein
MFDKFKKIEYNFDGIDKTIVDIATNYDLSELEEFFYSKKIDEDILLDRISSQTYSDPKYYFVPIYASKILNPFTQFPYTIEEQETLLNSYKAGFFSGISGACLQPGDLIAPSDSGFSAGFCVTGNFGYVNEVNNNVSKLKLLVVGSLGTGSHNIIRNTNGSWSYVSGGITLNLVEPYADSAIYFLNEFNIVCEDNTTAINEYVSLKNTGSTSNFSYINEKENLLDKNNIMTFVEENYVKKFEDKMNGIS